MSETPCEAVRINLHGWDARSSTWHGPNELGCSPVDKRLLRALRAATGKSWHGTITCGVSGESSTRFFVMIHDLADCAIASIYCEQSKCGPCEIIAVIPPDRRPHLREDFAFEFLTHARFLGSLGAGAEIQIHDAMAAALANSCETGAIVFSISTGVWPGDMDPVLSCCVEKVAVTLCQWMEDAPTASPARRSTPSKSLPRAALPTATSETGHRH